MVNSRRAATSAFRTTRSNPLETRTPAKPWASSCHSFDVIGPPLASPSVKRRARESDQPSVAYPRASSPPSAPAPRGPGGRTTVWHPAYVGPRSRCRRPGAQPAGSFSSRRPLVTHRGCCLARGSSQFSSPAPASRAARVTVSRSGHPPRHSRRYSNAASSRVGGRIFRSGRAQCHREDGCSSTA